MNILSRRFVPLGFALWAGLAALCAHAESPTSKSWPQPYEQISPKSVEWLKSKQWWPLTIAWQPPFAGQNATMVSMDENKLLAKRGLETKLLPLAAGTLVNKAVSEGQAQMGAGGNFPLTALVDQNAPIRVIAVTAPNLKHQVIVPKDSPITKMADFVGRTKPAVIGLALGSSAEFYLQAALASNNIRVGRDVVLKNVPQAEQAKLPPDLDAVVPWDSTTSLLTNELKTGRAIDSSYPYNVYQGSFFLHEDVIANAPDVARAIAGALIEADLITRDNPNRTADQMAAREELKAFPRSLMLQQIREYNLLYKPTFAYPLGKFWGSQNQDIALWLYIRGKLKKPLTRDDYAAKFDDGPMREVFKTLGWKVPVLPPYITSDWLRRSGSRTKLPEYDTYLTMKAPQPWPEKDDLVP